MESIDLFPAKSPRAALDELPVDLRSLVERARASAVRANIAAFEHAHDLGLVATALNGRRVGRIKAIDVCAPVLAMAPRTLQAYARVAWCWNDRDLASLAQRRDARGRYLSLSHLLALAPLPRGPRLHWIERTLAEAIDVRELRQGTRKNRGRYSSAPSAVESSPAMPSAASAASASVPASGGGGLSQAHFGSL